MRISIITPVFNSEKTIERTIKSVISEKKNNDIEYIVIDALSTDSSLEIVNLYKEYVDVIISEKDYGLYDALNKGIRLSSGDFVMLLAADDFLLLNSIQNFKLSLSSDTDVWCGSIVYSNGKSFFYSHSDHDLNKLYLYCSLRHPATFFRKELFFNYDFYNYFYKLNFRISIISRNAFTDAV